MRYLHTAATPLGWSIFFNLPSPGPSGRPTASHGTCKFFRTSGESRGGFDYRFRRVRQPQTAEAHNMLELFETPTFRFTSPDQVIRFVRILAVADQRNLQWVHSLRGPFKRSEILRTRPEHITRCSVDRKIGQPPHKADRHSHSYFRPAEGSTIHSRFEALLGCQSCLNGCMCTVRLWCLGQRRAPSPRTYFTASRQ